MPADIKNVLEILDKTAPEHLAESWDNSGIQINSGKQHVEKILVCLEINEAVVKEAIELRADFIVAHHPLIFKPLKKIDYQRYPEKLIIQLIKHDISVYSSHTPFDSAIGGNNDYIAKLLGLENTEILLPLNESFYKIVVFVPKNALEPVRQAMCACGAGRLGNYSDCTFSSSGIGTFKPNEKANPAIGLNNRFEQVEEYRLETIVAAENLKNVISGMISAHPYEMPAYDVFKLESGIAANGLGRTGYLDKDYKLSEMIDIVKDRLNIKASINWTGDPEKRIRKVGICTGSGSDLIAAAKEKGCDLYITGDIKYHDAHLANQLNIALIDAGHFYTEAFFSENMCEQLKMNLCGMTEIYCSKVSLNPFNVT